MVAVMAISFAGCGDAGKGGYKYDSVATESYTEPGYAGDYGYADEEAFLGEVADGSNGGGSSAQQDTFKDTNRKLIKTVNMSVETDAFDGFTAAVQSKVEELGGYIENLDTYNGSKYGTYKSEKRSNMTIRIPKQNADAFIAMVGEKGNITNQSLSVTDVTLTYVDIESRKESYESEQKRLLELLEQAETLEEILILEDKLSEVRYMLDSMESQLRSYDNKVDYTTIYLDINEVKVYTEPVVEPETYGQRISKSFITSCKNVFEGLKNFLVWFVGALPRLVVFAVFVAIIVFVVKAIIKACNKKAAKKNARLQQQYQANMEAMRLQQEAAAKQALKNQQPQQNPEKVQNQQAEQAANQPADNKAQQ